jgi:hypothetical protein
MIATIIAKAKRQDQNSRHIDFTQCINYSAIYWHKYGKQRAVRYILGLVAYFLIKYF